MRLVDVDNKTREAFFRCLQQDKPVDTRLLSIRKGWYENYRQRGLRAKLLVLDDGLTAGMCQYIPIEYSPLVGKDLMTILCLWVHGYEHGIGNQQSQGYGKFILSRIEEDARVSGSKGVAAWGMDWDINWMPVSFFEHMGYERADSEEKVVALWKPLAGNAEPPRLKRIEIPASPESDRVNVAVAANGWCLGCYKAVYAREAVQGLEDCVNYFEIEDPEKSAQLHLGEVGGIFLDGEVFLPYQLCTADSIRAEILRLHSRKKKL